MVMMKMVVIRPVMMTVLTHLFAVFSDLMFSQGYYSVLFATSS